MHCLGLKGNTLYQKALTPDIKAVALNSKAITANSKAIALRVKAVAPELKAVAAPFRVGERHVAHPLGWVSVASSRTL